MTDTELVDLLFHLSKRYGYEAITSKVKREIMEILRIDFGFNNIDSLRTYTDDDGNSLLHLVIGNEAGEWHGHEIMVLRFLLDLGVDINAKNKSGKTIFHLACKSRQISVVDLCIRRYPRIELLQLLKDVQDDFIAKDERGWSFLHCVSEYGKEAEIIDLLLNYSYDVDVDVTNLKGETPLHVAARYMNNIVVKALIEHGAKLDVKDDSGKTPLHLAVVDRKVFQLLLEAGADVNAKDKMGKTLLHNVTEPAVARLLLRFGAHVDILDVNGYSPLYDLLSNSRPHNSIILGEMLKYGADWQDSKVFELLNVNPRKCGVAARIYLTKYFIKLIAIDKHVELPFAVDKYKDPNNTFLNGCLKEVGSLKNYFIDDRTSVYCFLHKNRNRRCAYLHNEKLKNLVEDAAVEQKFPNYSVLILGCYNEAARRKPLLDSATHILNELSKIFLPDLCLDEILTFLSNDDLLRFIEAFKNVNLDDSTKSMHRIHV